ncbi:hypothetical protein HWV07_16685 [Natronomonas salina]|nr:hypothetical protein [Natronomonas salina]QLD90583.1 hypothetical protein HWV07_16685 [Natronomonas salina]
MSARNLIPVAAALAEPVAPKVPPTTREGLYARIALLYRRARARFARD